MKSTQTIQIDKMIERVESRYNPENDTITGAPTVTWTNEQLLQMIKRLVIVVEDLQDQIDQMRRNEE